MVGGEERVMKGERERKTETGSKGEKLCHEI